MQPNLKDNALDDSELDIRRLLRVVIDNRWSIAATAAVFLVLSLAYAFLAMPVYEADAVVQVEQQGGLSNLGDLTELLGGGAEAQSTTEIDIIQSRLVLGSAVDAENLTTEIIPGTIPLSWIFTGNRSSDLVISHFEVPLELEDENFKLEVGKNGAYTLFYDGDQIGVGQVGKLLTAYNGKLSLMVDQILADAGSSFKLSHHPRQFAVSELFDDLKVEEQGKQSGIIQLSLRGTNKTKIVRTVDWVAKAYVQQNIQRRAEEAQKGLEFLHNQLPKVKSDLYKSEEALNAFRLQRGSLDMELEAKAVLEQSSMLQLQLSDLAVKQAQISRTYSPEHPIYKALLDQRASVERQLESLQHRVADLPDTQQKLLRLTRDVQVNEQLYLQMFDKMQELDVVRAGTVGTVRVLDPADAQWKPVRPKKPLMVALAVFLGIIVGVAMALVREMMNQGVESAEELENADLAVLAVVPISEEQREV